MALPGFIQKAALAAAGVLGGFDYDGFLSQLNAKVVGLAFDRNAVESSEGRLSLSLGASLLARLYPQLCLMPTDDAARDHASTLLAEMRAINPAANISQDSEDAAVTLCVGLTPPSSGTAVCVGSEGWVARLSTEAPVGSGSTNNPFGAAAGACFGAANVFRAFFAASLPDGALDRTINLSLLDLNPAAENPLNSDLDDADLGESHLVGLGAIGNAAVWSLSRVPGLVGRLNLVDPETVDLSNLQRYVLAGQGDVGRPKVDLAMAQFRESRVEACPHGKGWGAYLKTRADWRLDQVAVAVDSATDRIRIQAALPRWIVNAWTQPGDLGVSRHLFTGEQACLACLYLPDGPTKNEDQLIAEAIGLPSATEEVRNMLATGRPVDRAFLGRVAVALSVPVDRLVQLEGRLLREFYSEAVCGGVVLALGKSDVEGRAQVPMAFQSVLAGVLLAAELVIHSLGVRQEPHPTITAIDLLRPLVSQLSSWRGKDPLDRCICQDDAYIAAYLEKYGAPPLREAD